MNRSLRGTLGLTIVGALALLPSTWGLGAPPAYHPTLGALGPGVLPWDAYVEPRQPRRLPEVDAAPLEIPVEAPAPDAHQMTAFPPPPPLPDPAPNDAEYFTLDELKAEMKKLAWTKGDFKIVPYGYLWANMVYATEKTFPGSYTLYVQSADTHGQDEFVIDARTTRVGLRFSGPGWRAFPDAKMDGKITIDFHGQFITENKPGVLLRHAYWELKSDTFRLLAGQTSDVISPLYPGTLMYSVGWGGGNIGYRRAQFRAERYLAFSDTFLLTAQASLNADITSDFRTDPMICGCPAGWPVLESRLGVTLGPRGPYHAPIEFGVSGHIGEQVFRRPIDRLTRRTWSFNVDLRIPITHRLGVQGEFFTGENLGTYLGGVLQGVDRNSWRAVRSTGGWFEVWCDWHPRLHSHAGCGVDDPFDTDVTTPETGRTYNHFMFANVSCDVTNDFVVGLEVSSWKTLFVDLRPGESVRLELMAKYAF